MSTNKEVMEVKTEVVPTNNLPQPIDITGLLEKVVDKGPEAIQMLEGLLALQDKQEKKIALGQFNKAKAKCQSELPPVKKTRTVNKKNSTQVMYRYASLDDARKVCMPVMCQNGFSDGWKTENQEKGTLITYTVRHDLGHEESTSMFCPMEQSQYMNAIQRSGSTITYGKRYTFCDFWGIVLDEDDDGRGNSEKGNQAPQQKPEPVKIEARPDAIKFIDDVYQSLTTLEKWDKFEKDLIERGANPPEIDYCNNLRATWEQNDANNLKNL